MFYTTIGSVNGTDRQTATHRRVWVLCLMSDSTVNRVTSGSSPLRQWDKSSRVRTHPICQKFFVSLSGRLSAIWCTGRAGMVGMHTKQWITAFSTPLSDQWSVISVADGCKYRLSQLNPQTMSSQVLTQCSHTTHANSAPLRWGSTLTPHRSYFTVGISENLWIQFRRHFTDTWLTTTD